MRRVAEVGPLLTTDVNGTPITTIASAATAYSSWINPFGATLVIFGIHDMQTGGTPNSPSNMDVELGWGESGTYTLISHENPFNLKLATAMVGNTLRGRGWATSLVGYNHAIPYALIPITVERCRLTLTAGATADLLKPVFRAWLVQDGTVENLTPQYMG